jgi:hypothetical protein
MSEIKPVAYISNDADLPLKEDGKYWLECEPSDHRTPLYPAAALEASQNEVMKLQKENTVQAKRIAELEQQNLAYWGELVCGKH